MRGRVFYWYFKNREDLLDSLLDYWQATNTKAIVTAATAPATSINQALGKSVPVGWGPSTEGGIHTQLDFAIREWARRSGAVRRAVDISDAARIDAICRMYERFGYAKMKRMSAPEFWYFTQIGYDAAGSA